MSYTRFAADSDVYVFLCVSGYLECCGCSLSDDWRYDTTDAMLAHLDEHRKAGHAVPQDCIDRLKEEREEIDAWIPQRQAEEAATKGQRLD